MKKITSLSLFFPVFNDARIIPVLVEKANKTAQEITDDYEIICINDGSTDTTYQVLNHLQENYSRLKIIHHKKNKGYGGALISGFENSTKEWIFYTDGDGQYDPNELTSLVNVLQNGVDVVNGYKLKREDSLIRKIVGNLNNFLVHAFFPIPISDIDCDFRLIRSSLMKKIELTFSSGTICTELILKLQKQGAGFTEVGVHHYKRKFGQSQFFSFIRVIQTIIDNTKLFLAFKRNKL
ncbi:MAG: hypothetical protein A3F31_04040 [Candidatus Levybacteria bacterium RIFCSPHIGHO2_12_FULL_38_12]|nr:MAG: hypothetical protein A2770_02430 [Candidatus Levybacteria bacterium RIFCSPHIGHO2_01_FULL_38_12]OGH21935.1 MAG: hypothetical protein A3D75_00650 [Candidatus Levybacteria bacterium RIFCSPHIGHO2_02_FULL_37_18]OGH22867.1 MAG: hypothetical protein A3F31_04040 [Candidatus Levybacteria bacterium RIFCSPHIGHO2_12_FULL_38_12]OGH33592.1 MAG: hypothetical protein A3A47_01995 [Candidatus Levybacteria bacterium RIFCSPLOWO2_01_FULL_37_20]OGH44513.1 MAG: hypothetical protein A3J14_03685 [Candidatus Lev